MPLLDRADIDESTLTEGQRQWRKHGVLLLPKFLPDNLIDAYSEVREALNKPGGWRTPTPYEHVPELRQAALYPPMMAKMKELIGEDMLLHLALTGWVSTERNWHQDDYLNPDFVNSYYVAAWMALDDIHADSGPFEYIPGSHKWPLLRGEKVRQAMTAKELENFDHWPKVSEEFVAPATEAEIAKRKAPVRQFIAKRGDVLLWHGRLMHRGTVANVPGMRRKSLICHYSSAERRIDMKDQQADENGNLYAKFGRRLE